MATNEYVNKVEFGNTTIMDISDTTADAADVIDGEVFYTKSGARSVGTLGDATTTTHGLMSAADKEKLDAISAFNCQEFEVEIQTTDWSNGSYTWTNSAVTTTCLVLVDFQDDVIGAYRGSLNYTKVTGGVQFDLDGTPTDDFTVVITIIDAASANGGGQETDPTIYEWAKAATKPTYTAQEVGALPADTVIPTVPTNVSDFTNDAGYLTSHQDISGKANSADLATVATTGDYDDLLNKPTIPTVPTNVSAFTNDSGYLTSVATMTGATSSDNGTAGLIPAPTSADREKFFRGDGTWQDGGRPMVILSYGNSTWAQFEEAYNNNVIVYCRASSNSNPASGSQTRMAFMAYVNNATTPTEVEFQYYRSMSSHSATAMGDQVFVYKLTKTGGWTVTTRDASIKEIKAATNTPLSVSWSSNVVTLTNTMTADDMPMSSSDSTTAKAAIEAKQSALIRKVAQGAINSQWVELDVNTGEELVGGYGSAWYPVCFNYNPTTSKYQAYCPYALTPGDGLNVVYFVKT